MSAKDASGHIKMLKNIAIVLLIIMLSTVMLPCINIVSYGSQYREQTKVEEIDEINYPGYKELIKELQKEHPNWTFTLLYTGLDWNTVLYNEKEVIGHDSNLIQGKTGEWVCQSSTCLNPDGTSKSWEGTNWYCASYKALSYYMDPRNFLTAEQLFQFERLSYTEGIYTIEGIEKIIANTFMSNTSPREYYKNEKYTDKTFAQIMLEAGQSKNISPYHIASRIRQEVVKTGGVPSDSVTGKVAGYEGVYNFYNIGATTGAGAIARGLKHAKGKEWFSPETAITGGAEYIAKKYIAIGQDTLYLQKFNVDSQDGVLYSHQYQANIQAPQSEGKGIYKTYSELGILEANINFVIPVYENMPATISQIPTAQKFQIVTENVVVKGTNINIRESGSLSAKAITKVNTGDILLRIEDGSTEVDELVWDKVVLPDGTIGYIADKYITKTEDVITGEVEAYTSTGANIRNGPGLTGTTIMKTIPTGAKITIIDSGKYSLDGYTWERIKLSDGTQGYIAAEYLNSTLGSYEGNIVKVTANGSLQLRKEPGTTAEILKSLITGELLIQTETNVATVDGLQWDKVKTLTGTEGYVASKYLELIAEKLEKEEPEDEVTETPKEENPEESSKPEQPNSPEEMTKIVIDEENKIIKCEPNVKVSHLQEQKEKVVIMDKTGTAITDTESMLATGNTVIIDEVVYTVVKLGDVNSDGKINSGDLLRVKKHLLNAISLENTAESNSADLTKDGKINSGDLLKIKKYLLEVSNIEL